MSPLIIDTLPVDRHFDAVIVPGGGLDPATACPNPWVQARLNAAATLNSRTRYFIVLSQGTSHRPPPLDTTSRPISEAAASARHLVQAGVSPDRVLLDAWSLDTIGNAFFARAMHADPLRLNSLCVITSDFHMPRTAAIFDWLFALDHRCTNITYVITPDHGMSQHQLDARRQKEQAALHTLRTVTIPNCTTMAALAQFVFTRHGAYDAAHVAQYEYDVGQSTGTHAQDGNEKKKNKNLMNADTLSTY